MRPFVLGQAACCGELGVRQGEDDPLTAVARASWLQLARLLQGLDAGLPVARSGNESSPGTARRIPGLELARWTSFDRPWPRPASAGSKGYCRVVRRQRHIAARPRWLALDRRWLRLNSPAVCRAHGTIVQHTWIVRGGGPAPPCDIESPRGFPGERIRVHDSPRSRPDRRTARAGPGPSGTVLPTTRPSRHSKRKLGGC